MYTKITNSGELMTEELVYIAENMLEQKIPEPFRSFLLRHNGGRPDAADFRMAGTCAGATQGGTIKSFLGIGMPERTFNLDYVLETFGDRVPDWSFPIARDPGGNLILLAAKGARKGKIYFWDHEREADEGDPPTEDNLYLIANNFEEFLKNLTGN
jgi:hypothetical protein